MDKQVDQHFYYYYYYKCFKNFSATANWVTAKWSFYCVLSFSSLRYTWCSSSYSRRLREEVPLNYLLYNLSSCHKRIEICITQIGITTRIRVTTIQDLLSINGQIYATFRASRITSYTIQVIVINLEKLYTSQTYLFHCDLRVYTQASSPKVFLLIRFSAINHYMYRWLLLSQGRSVHLVQHLILEPFVEIL